jgi:hypothetical protein
LNFGFFRRMCQNLQVAILSSAMAHSGKVQSGGCLNLQFSTQQGLSFQTALQTFSSSFFIRS